MIWDCGSSDSQTLQSYANQFGTLAADPLSPPTLVHSSCFKNGVSSINKPIRRTLNNCLRAPIEQAICSF